MEARRITDFPKLTFANIHAVIEQTILGGSFRAENPNGRGSAGLVCILKGNVTYNFYNRSISVQAGDLLFLPNGSKYSFTIEKEDYNYIFVNFDFLENVEIAPEVFKFKTDRMERIFRQMLKTYTARPPEFREECMISLYSVYSHIRRESSAKYLPSAKRESIENAAAHIRENHRSPSATIADAAKKANLSIAHFRRLFTQIYSVCPQEYMLDLRLNTAKNLLSASDLSVSEIAYESGFSSPYYFSRIFRIKTGMTPTEYKNKYNCM